MIGRGWRARTGAARRDDPRRAVIDIGSNTVRLVIYGGPQRAPAVLWNEKVSARLGRDLAETGLIPRDAEEEALTALARFVRIVHDLEIDRVEAVATAAPREAGNGAAFLSRVAALGLDVRLLDGAEEACASAFGAIGAFPGAAGLVADLGGGSLELVPIAEGACGSGYSLPLGTLRLPALRAKPGFARTVSRMLKALDLPTTHPQPLYMIGGTWRAFAVFVMRATDHPLTDPHAFQLTAQDADHFAKLVQRAQPAKLAQTRGVSGMRAEKLPDAATLLRALLAQLRPERLIFSSWGLREGLHYRRLDDQTQARDPLIDGVAAFVSRPGPGMADAALLRDWIAPVRTHADAVGDRLGLAAAHLAPALHGVEPNLRPAHALEWALDKRWVGITQEQRGILAAILVASLGHTMLPDRVIRLAPAATLAQALAAGLALRLAQRLGAGSRQGLAASRLSVADGVLSLTLSPSHGALAGGPVAKDLTALAAMLGLQARLAVD